MKSGEQEGQAVAWYQQDHLVTYREGDVGTVTYPSVFYFPDYR